MGLVETIEDFDFAGCPRDTRLASGMRIDEALSLARIHSIALEEIAADISRVSPAGSPAAAWASMILDFNPEVAH